MDVMERLAALESEVKGLRARVASIEGQFDFISRQLRDAQLYMHNRFDAVEGRLDKMDARLDKVDARLDKVDARLQTMDAKLDAMPRAIIEALRESRQ